MERRHIAFAFTWAIDGGEWSAKRSDHLYSRQKDRSTRHTGGKVGNRVELSAVEKRKSLTRTKNRTQFVYRSDPNIVALKFLQRCRL
jgi:hypothetical protein